MRSTAWAARRRLRARGGRGEVAVFDIVLLVPLLLVALLFLQTAISTTGVQVSENVNGSRYAAQALSTILGSTVPATQTWWWSPPWPWGCGCWYNTWIADAPVGWLTVYDVYLVSCGVTTQAQLDQPGWEGYDIQRVAESVSAGNDPGAPPIVPPGSPNTFWEFSYAFNGTALGGSYACPGPTEPVRSNDGNITPSYSANMYAWDTVLAPDPEFPDEGPVMVVLSLWSP